MRTIGFIGAGNMAETIISGLCRELYQQRLEDICFFEPSIERRDVLSARYGVASCDSNASLYATCDVVVLAVKPQQFQGVLEALRADGALQKKPLIISIMAGVPLVRIIDALQNQRVVRVMPNIAAKVCEAMSVLSPATACDAEDRQTAEDIFNTVGRTLLLSEAQLDAASTMNGCGPAFFFQLAEAAADALVALGISRRMAYDLTAQTMAGAAALMLEPGALPAQLKDMVTSPGGTTIAGCKALEAHGARAAMMAAVDASYEQTKRM